MGPCGWTPDYTACGGCKCDSLGELSSEAQTVIEDMAVDFLWRWTGMQFGLCEQTIRPCRQDCMTGISTYTGWSGRDYGYGTAGPWTPVIINGIWHNIGCGGACGDTCGCNTLASLTFDLPAYDVTSVVIDGTVLDPSKYRVDNYRQLVRQDGYQWPMCQDLNLPPGQPDTWSVTYRVGQPVPAGGQIAAGLLACEFAKAACNDSSCALPQRWQSVSRQGLTITSEATRAALRQSSASGSSNPETGIWLVDSWVDSVMKTPQRFAIASPDYRGSGRRTTFQG